MAAAKMWFRAAIPRRSQHPLHEGRERPADLSACYYPLVLVDGEEGVTTTPLFLGANDEHRSIRPMIRLADLRTAAARAPADNAWMLHLANAELVCTFSDADVSTPQRRVFATAAVLLGAHNGGAVDDVLRPLCYPSVREALRALLPPPSPSKGAAAAKRAPPRLDEFPALGTSATSPATPPPKAATPSRGAWAQVAAATAPPPRTVVASAPAARSVVSAPTAAPPPVAAAVPVGAEGTPRALDTPEFQGLQLVVGRGALQLLPPTSDIAARYRIAWSAMWSECACTFCGASTFMMPPCGCPILVCNSCVGRSSLTCPTCAVPLRKDKLRRNDLACNMLRIFSEFGSAALGIAATADRAHA